MAPQDDLTAERAATLIQSVFLANEKEWRTWYATANSGTAQQPAPDGVAQRLVDAVAQALKTARQEALREAASKLGIGDSSGLLDAPCLWCGYNGRGYYQVGTHDKSCIWHTVGGRNERLDRLASEGGT